MSTLNTLQNNPYVNVHDTIVDISYRHKNCSLPIRNIRKMYLSKKKLGSWSSIPGATLLVADNNYELHIQTSDDNEITFNIKSSERRHFIDLISWIRNGHCAN